MPGVSSRRGWLRRLATLLGVLLALVSVVLGAVLALWLGAEQRGGVPHRDVVLNDTIPATLYVPGTVPSGPTAVDLPAPSPGAPRPPVVVLAHGHSADRATMSTLARRIAAAGYAVVTFDFRGHGGNSDRHESHGFDGRRADLRTVVDWARRSPYVDGSRLVVAGHSMGAAAVVDFATTDPRPVATIALGGSVAIVEGTVRPRNVLFLVAEDDPDVIRDEVAATARVFSDSDVRFGESRGRTTDGSAIGMREVSGTGHLSMLFANDTAAQMVDWIRRSAGPGSAPMPVSDPRLGLVGGYLLCALGLAVLIGLLAGSLVPRLSGATRGSWRALALVGLALVAPLPVLAWGDAGSLIGLESGGSLLVLLGAAGGLLLAAGQVSSVRAWFRLPGPDWSAAAAGGARPVRLGPVALLAAGWVVLLVLPIGPVVHGFAPTPQRVLTGMVAVLLLVPFFLAVDGYLRRGPIVGAAVRSALARVLVLAVALGGAFTGVLPGMLALYVLVLVPFFVLLELVVLGVHARSRDYRLTALIQAGAVGWLLSMLSPVLW